MYPPGHCRAIHLGLKSTHDWRHICFDFKLVQAELAGRRCGETPTQGEQSRLQAERQPTKDVADAGRSSPGTRLANRHMGYSGSLCQFSILMQAARRGKVRSAPATSATTRACSCLSPSAHPRNCESVAVRAHLARLVQASSSWRLSPRSRLERCRP